MAKMVDRETRQKGTDEARGRETQANPREKRGQRDVVKNSRIQRILGFSENKILQAGEQHWPRSVLLFNKFQIIGGTQNISLEQKNRRLISIRNETPSSR